MEYESVLGGIPGFDYYYSTEDGKIFSKMRSQLEELHGSISADGYQIVRLTNSGGDKSGYRVHRLVALTWLDNPDNLKIVNHLDGNKTNNNVDNLEWVSSSQNIQHAHDTGLIKNAKKQVCQVDKDGKLVKVYASVTEAAKGVNTSIGQISGVCSGKKRTCNGYFWFYKEDYDKGKKTRANGHCKEVLQYTLDGKLVRRYESVAEAAKITKLAPQNISAACTGRQETSGGFKWKYAPKKTVEKKKDPDEIADWRSLKEFPRYKISKEGRIYSYVTHKYIKISRVKDKRDYAFLLNALNKPKNILIHRLVALAYIPNPNNWPVVNHKDGDCYNNTVENLEWCTHQMNVQHAYDNNLNSNKRGIIRTDSNGKEEYFDSIVNAARGVKVNPSAIGFSVRHNSNCKGFRFRYAPQPVKIERGS